MSTQVNESLKTTVSFTVENTQDSLKRLVLFPGHYNTQQIILKEDKAYLLRTLAKALSDAGYAPVDEVADDFNAAVAEYFIFKVQGKSARTRMVDLVDFVKHSDLSITKIRITDLSNDSTHELFNHEIEVAASKIGTKGESDIIQMSTYVNPRNFQQNVIEIDLEADALELNATTVMIMDVVAKGKFQIDYVLE